MQVRKTGRLLVESYGTWLLFQRLDDASKDSDIPKNVPFAFAINNRNIIGVPFAVREFVGRGYKDFSNRLAAVAAQNVSACPPPFPLPLRLQGTMTRCWPKSLPTITRHTLDTR